ncbi:MAG: RNA 2'-phosphotransferase [Microscillaceae bacterium]|nr:RNA 2'-phosphotransferase [Microscillaceae bacterium]
MDEKKIIQTSKRLSLVLRHQPQLIGIELDEQGWVSVEILLQAFCKHFYPIDLEHLCEVVANNNKKRFAFSEDTQKIRASQGHSVEIRLGYEPVEPPVQLYHGTATRFLESIRKSGLQKQKRHHVHLSADEDTARQVGSRHGVPFILTIKSGEMHRAGFAFFRSENGVWLTELVPVAYIIFP